MSIRIWSARTAEQDLARLCMVVHAYYPIGEPRVERESRGALAAGHPVDVVCLRLPGESPREVVDGVRVHRVGMTHQRGAGMLALLREYVLFAVRATLLTAWITRGLVRGRGWIVQVHTPPDFLILVALLPKLLGAQVVLDIHDLSTHLFGARYRDVGVMGRLIARLLNVTERVACGVADRVITVHEPYRAELISHGIRPERVSVVMNAADESLIERARAAIVRDGGHAPFTIAYHGTITRPYGVDLLVEALPRVRAELGEVRCLILGEGDALESIRERAGSLGIADSIEFSGRYLPIEQALALVGAADCGVVPNRPTEYNRFALSSKLFEYVALGLPAVVAQLETLTGHFDPDEVAFFTPGDPDALADALLWVAADAQRAGAMAARAGRRSGEYTWSANRARYLSLIDAPGPAARACEVPVALAPAEEIS